MAKPLQKGWLPSCASQTQQEEASSDPKAASDNSANETHITGFGVMPVLMKFMQLLDLSWLLLFLPLCKVQVVTTQLCWDVQERLGTAALAALKNHRCDLLYHLWVSASELFAPVLCSRREEGHSS